MQAGLSLLWIYLSFCRFCWALAHLLVVHDVLSAVCGTQYLPRLDNV